MDGVAARAKSNRSDLKSVLAMVFVQIAYTGINVVYKLAANDGMNLRILVAYRLSFGALCMVPVALLLERNSTAKLAPTVVFEAFLCGLFGGTLTHNLYLQSIALTSGTFAAAMFNLVPPITFIIGVTIGLERLNIGSAGGKAKVIGTSIGVGGAMLLTFYKGTEVNIWSTHAYLLGSARHPPLLRGGSSNRLIGALLATCSAVSFAIWLVLQAKMCYKYPNPYSASALMNVMAASQSMVYAICTDRNPSHWKLGWNVRLMAALYSGIVGSAIVVSIIVWCVQKKGPLFVAVFNPLMLVLVAIAGSLMLNETLHVGSIVGAVLIVFALYMVIWGKGHEAHNVERIAKLPSHVNSGKHERNEGHGPTEQLEGAYNEMERKDNPSSDLCPVSNQM